MRQISICAVVNPQDWVPRYIFQSYHPYQKFSRSLFPKIKGEKRLVILREVDDLDGPIAMREDVKCFRKSLYVVPKKYWRPLRRND